MKQSLFLAAASTALAAVLASPSFGADGDSVKNAKTACVKDSTPAPESHVDFSAPGLEFDPLAPGSARPVETPGEQKMIVNPATVTLFPTQQQPTEAEGKKVHAKHPCP